MSDSLNLCFLKSDVSKSLRSLIKKSDCEQMAQVDHQKWATMRDLLISLTKKIWIKSCFLYVLKKCFNEWFAQSLFFKERCERIAQVAHEKRVTVSKWPRLLTKNKHPERFALLTHQKWAIVSESPRSITKNERMSKSLVLLTELLIRSFLHKKKAICSENRWANSQPRIFGNWPP